MYEEPKKFPKSNPKLQDDMIKIADKFNAPPECISLSTTRFLKDSSYQTVCQLPFCAVITPFCKPHGENLPTVDFRRNLIPRCDRCKAYINPFVILMNKDKKWKCNLCKCPNYFPKDYQRPKSKDGIFLPYNHKTELSNGCYDFLIDQ